MGTTSVDPEALRAAARRIDSASELLLAAVHQHLGALQSGGASRFESPLRTALDRLAEQMLEWSHAARELAEALWVGAERHSAADMHAAGVIR